MGREYVLKVPPGALASQNPSLELEEEMRSQRAHLSLLPLATLVSPLLCQLKFSGGVSSSSSNSNSPSSANRNTNSRPTDVDEKFFFGGDGAPSLTGNQALDGGIVGLGLGALGAAVLGPTIQGALNGGQQSQGYSCGRRKRQANFGGQTSGGEGGQDIDGDERFFLPTGQGCTCNGRRRRQAPGENEPGTRFFGGLFGGQQPHCGSCCYNTQPFNNNNCGDLQRSNRYQNNPWSYRACGNQG